MKHTFNISINKNNRPSNNNKYTNSTYIDSLILSNLKKAAPYLIDDEFENENKKTTTYYFTNNKPKKNITINITKTKSNKISDTEFTKALKTIFSMSDNRDTYDFKLDDGTPIKMFGDEIQIGYELLPINEATLYLYDKLSESSKKNIIDIYIKLNK